jgi:hypothetical protein
MTHSDLLFRVQQLQFDARSEAEALLLGFIRQTFPQLDITVLQLRPQVTSLNSFNGFLTLKDGSRLFFKTHVEQDNAVSEFYNAEMLESAGYRVVRPLHTSTASGQQILIYPMIEAPAVFEIARLLEEHPETSPVSLDNLTHAQQASDRALYGHYERTLQWQEAAQAAKAPIHQLFFHRLTGGRLERFYADDITIDLAGQRLLLQHLKTRQWTINGAHYEQTLGDLIAEATALLSPAQAGPSIIGHGDAHNGNVFYEPDDLRFFDPAFAGRHHPLLDIVKPIFHNVFAMWMYFSAEEEARLDIKTVVSGTRWHVQHNYVINPVRQMFLHSKLTHTLIPTLKLLNARGWLEPDWRRRIKLALMCCPLLTMNLTTFPSKIALLGVCWSIQMGGESSQQKSLIDQILDEASRQAGIQL